MEVTSQINGLVADCLPSGSTVSGRVGKFLPSFFRLDFGLFIRDNNMVLMSHGVADKNYLFQRDADGVPYVNALEHLFVPGPWLRNRLLAMPEITLRPDQISVVGWPRLDLLLKLLANGAGASVPRKKEGPLVLWAPSHDFRKRGPEQTSSSSYPVFERDFQELSLIYDSVASLHPRNRTDKNPTSHVLIAADVVISDFGTMVYEAWALGKPVIFPSWLIGDHVRTYLPGSAEAHIFENKIGYHAESPEHLREILASEPVVTADVREFMDQYLPPALSGKSAETVAGILLRLAGRSSS